MNIRTKINTLIDVFFEVIIPAIMKAIRWCRDNVKVKPVWLTYFPFVGWLYPFIAMKNDAFAMHHGKQAFIMAVVFTAAPIILTFSTVFIPISYRGAEADRGDHGLPLAPGLFRLCPALQR